MDKSVRGSSTVFFTLMLLLVSSLLFTLLEGARMAGLKAVVHMDTELVTHSVMAEYVTPLFERYQLFARYAGDSAGALDITSVEESAKELQKDNLSNGRELAVTYDMYHMKDISSRISNYTLLTDGEGQVFCQLVAEYMKNNLTQEAANAVYQKITQADEVTKEAGDLDERREKAIEEIEKASGQDEADGQDEAIEQSGFGEQDAAIEQSGFGERDAAIEQGGFDGQNAATEQSGFDGQDEVSGQDGTSKSDREPENPIEYVAKWKDKGVLALIEADEEKLSQETIDISNSMMKRELNTGTKKLEAVSDWYDRTLVQEYLMKYFSCYTNMREDTLLRYEIEYMIAGKEDDRANLSSVASRILAIREAANFIYLQTDSAKCKEAYTLATLLAGAAGNPVLIKLIQEGILAAWAFAESVSDMRSLLQGNKIPIVKTSGDWSTDVGALRDKEKFETAKECSSGLDYEDYLRILLYMQSQKEISYRAMDLMEANLQQISGYENFHMDCMVEEADVTCSYQAAPLFLSFVTISKVQKLSYDWDYTVTGSYFEKK